jgi:excisionase family DNA binding protein
MVMKVVLIPHGHNLVQLHDLPYDGVMTQTRTTHEAATLLHTTAHTIATWCRTGLLTAVKTGRRWTIRTSTIARLIRPTTDRPHPGKHRAPRTSRAARRTAARTQARRTAIEHAARVIDHHQRARIACANSGRTLARDYLVSLGLDDEFIAKYESAFGRAVAKQYRATHHTEPEHGGRVILRGRIWHTMKYTDVTDLEAGARAYKRTAHLLAA